MRISSTPYFRFLAVSLTAFALTTVSALADTSLPPPTSATTTTTTTTTTAPAPDPTTSTTTDPTLIDPTLSPTGGTTTTTSPTVADYDFWWDTVIPMLMMMYPDATYDELCAYALVDFNLLPPDSTTTSP